MKLEELKQALLWKRHVGNTNVPITDIVENHTLVTPGCLFVAIRGQRHDGHDFVQFAVEQGAAAVVVEEEQADLFVPQLVVPDSREAVAILANVFFRHPSKDLRVIGVTGTKGKATTTFLIDALLRHHGHETGLMGTLFRRVGDQTTESSNTTSEALVTQRALRGMADAGAKYAVIEVSSEGLEKKRLRGTVFRQAILTNFAQDHLNFHGTMDNYRAAKGKFFSWVGNAYADRLDEQSFAIINADDPNSAFFLGCCSCQTVTYGVDHPGADFRAVNISVTSDGVSFTLVSPDGTHPVHLPVSLAAKFNVYNTLAAAASVWLEGVPLSVLECLRTFPGVPGRMELVDAGQPYRIVVDYSHTPDSLDKALQTVREITSGRVIVVVGCGGDRDASKRPLMAQIAVERSDLAIFTSDNPRTEDPEKILDDMEKGLASSLVPHRRFLDRREAIEYAITSATDGDLVLIAGKGHETYQLIGDVKHHFDDREVASDAVRKTSQRKA